MLTNNNPFKLEKYRSHLAKERLYGDFVKTYRNTVGAIKNNNSSKFWDKLNQRPYVSQNNDPMAYHRLIIVTDLLKEIGLKQKKVLNVGPGRGDLENLVFTKNEFRDFEWHGIDISTNSIARLRKEFPKGKFNKGKIEKLTYKKNYFDCVVIMEVMEHISTKNTFKALGEANRVLKKSGKLIVTVPLNENLEEMVKKGQNPSAHVRVYTPEVIKAELEISGFRIVETKFLYAFSNNYLLKSLLVKLLPFLRAPNSMIILCQKK
jgi:2-polyprenyl-3-methyl-5-hydroxy-6-metoxy-1,4-benzoquinol methylase